MRKYFFDNQLEAVIYFIFLSLIPVISVYTQYIVGDKTMYLSFIVSGFSMTYDYLIISKNSICKRLWWESLVAILVLIATTGYGILGLINILNTDNFSKYEIKDLLIISILSIVLLVNALEVLLLIISDYKKRYSKCTNGQLLKAAQQV